MGATSRLHEGGCHCGGLRFSTPLDPADGTIKCNCTYCAKSRFWHARAEVSDFLAYGEAHDYQGRNPAAHHFFCPRCGVHVYDRIDAPNMLGRPYVNVSVACFDNLDVGLWAEAPIRYCDGLNNDWGAAPTETRHL